MNVVSDEKDIAHLGVVKVDIMSVVVKELRVH